MQHYYLYTICTFSTHHHDPPACSLLSDSATCCFGSHGILNDNDMQMIHDVIHADSSATEAEMRGA